MSWITNVLNSIASFFQSDKVKKAFQTAAELAQIALPIVQSINIMVPNKTLDEVVGAYRSYGVPFASTVFTDDPNAVGNALLNLATAVLKDKLPADKANVATNVLHTAVQLAVTATKAS
jgi:hypothetical protein